MTDQDDTLDAEIFSALPAERKVEIAAELLKRGDMKAIQNLGIEIIDAEEWAERGESDAVRIKPSTT